MAGKSSGASLTRTQTAVWLVGQPEKNLPSNVLPTTGDALRTFFHYYKTVKQTVPASAISTSADLINIWIKARIPMTCQLHTASKLRACVDEYNLIKKNRRRASDSQRARENEFTAKLSLLFDIAHRDADALIKNEEDKLFLKDQRDTRLMKMSGEDLRLSQQEERAAQRRQAEAGRKQREEERRQASAIQPILSHILSLRSECDDNSEPDNIDDDDDDDVDDDDDDFEIEIPLYHKKHLCDQVDDEETSVSKKPRVLEDILSSPDFSSVLDRISLSAQKFTILAASIANASGQDLLSVPLSRSTVRRKRIEHRSSTENRIRQEFMSSEKPPLVVHWDGKIMRNTTNLVDPKSSVHRIAVSVTGPHLDKTLEIVKISTGTGLAQAKVIGHHYGKLLTKLLAFLSTPQRRTRAPRMVLVCCWNN